MAAPMSFCPGGAELDDVYLDEDGFYFEGGSGKIFDPVVQAGSGISRGGFKLPSQKETESKSKQKKSHVKPDKSSFSPTKCLSGGDFQMSIVRGDQKMVQRYLDEGFLVDTILHSGWTGLMYAASAANAEVVKLLLDRGANPNFNQDMYTVLMCACGCLGHDAQHVLECVSLLLGKGASVNSYDRYHMSPIIYAAKVGRQDVVQTLLEAGANINKQESRGWTALSWAVSKGHKSTVKALLEAKADRALKHCNGDTVLDVAQTMDNQEMADLLQGKERKRTAFETQTVTMTTDTRLPTASSSTDSYGTTYGELELFLCGLDLSAFVPLFQSQHVDFNTFLRMTEADLIKMGINQIGVRKKIVDGIHDVHKQEWKKGSLPTVQYQKSLSCAEAIAMIANISKHTRYITTTLGFVQDQIKTQPAVVEQLQDGTGPKQLHQHTVDTVKNVSALQTQLDGMKQQLEQILKTGNYDPPDTIVQKPVKRSRISSRVYVYGLIASAAICVVVTWKRQSILDGIRTAWPINRYF